MADIAPFIRETKIETQQGNGTGGEDRIRPLFSPLRFSVEEQRLVVASLGLPALDGALADALSAYGKTRHVVGRIHGKEQHESQQIHAYQYENAVHQPACDISDHGRSAKCASASAGALSRRRATCQAMTPPAPSRPASSHKGHHKGAFHSFIFCARKAGSIR